MSKLHPLARRVLAVFLVLLATASCGLGDLSIDEADPDSIPADPTYEGEVRPLMRYYCVACHAPSSQLGTAHDFDYSTYEGTKAGYGGILDTVFEQQSMPPGAARRMSPREEAIVKRWAEQGFKEKPTP
ncbi:MAG: hypothetical protein KC503_42755 [Myxococcales bacterium]|nr:hypothetical protein [Myxococcales bacterium]